jgi:hypothetical protein
VEEAANRADIELENDAERKGQDFGGRYRLLSIPPLQVLYQASVWIALWKSSRLSIDNRYSSRTSFSPRQHSCASILPHKLFAHFVRHRTQSALRP